MRHLTVYGDSIAAGYGARSGAGFVPRLAALEAAKAARASTAETGAATVPYLNFGQAGMTSFQLASAFVYNEPWVDGLRNSQANCVLIGGDDIINDLATLLTGNAQGMRRALAASAAAYRRSLARIRRISKAPLAVGTIYNPYPETPLAVSVIDAYNRLVIEPAAATAGAVIAPVHAAFAGNQAALIYGYGGGVAGRPGSGGIAFPVHPNTKGHQVIADVFASVIP